jgi:Cd2+/Zn2+-exporting ATPase
MADKHSHESGDNHHDHDHGGISGKRSELIFSLICGTFLVIGFLIQKAFPQVPTPVSIGCYIIAYFFGGFYTLKEAMAAIGKGKFEIDFLMLVAAAGAAALGKWPEGALLLFLFSLGHSLEHMAMDKARKSIEALAGLAPKTALVRRNGEQLEIPVEQLLISEVVIVKPNSKIPADGFVIAGNSSVNQAPITGESIRWKNGR